MRFDHLGQNNQIIFKREDWYITEKRVPGQVFNLTLDVKGVPWAKEDIIVPKFVSKTVAWPLYGLHKTLDDAFSHFSNIGFCKRLLLEEKEKIELKRMGSSVDTGPEPRCSTFPLHETPYMDHLLERAR